MAESSRKVGKKTCQLLPPEVHHLVRSGVVISSMGQCVEELVMNSIDAEASEIQVFVNTESFTVRVTDDGFGFTKEDLGSVGIRSSTSKCRTIGDLNNLKYYGYRGESLASIIETSGTVEIMSKSKLSSHTYSRKFISGRPDNVHRCSSRNNKKFAGTTVTVEQLLSNYPVRQKKLDRSIQLEEVKICIEQVAIINPGVCFSLRNESNGEQILCIQKSSSFIEAFKQICVQKLNEKLAVNSSNFIEEHHQYDVFMFSGYVGKEAHTSKKLQFVYVNKRFIKARSKVHRLFYHLLKPVLNLGQSQKQDSAKKYPTVGSSKAAIYPVFVLSIKCPWSEYDVSLKPDKTLSEFRNWDTVHRGLECFVLRLKSYINAESRTQTLLEVPKSSNLNNVKYGLGKTMADFYSTAVNAPTLARSKSQDMESNDSSSGNAPDASVPLPLGDSSKLKFNSKRKSSPKFLGFAAKKRIIDTRGIGKRMKNDSKIVTVCNGSGSAEKRRHKVANGNLNGILNKFTCFRLSPAFQRVNSHDSLQKKSLNKISSNSSIDYNHHNDSHPEDSTRGFNVSKQDLSAFKSPAPEDRALEWLKNQNQHKPIELDIFDIDTEQTNRVTKDKSKVAYASIVDNYCKSFCDTHCGQEGNISSNTMKSLKLLSKSMWDSSSQQQQSSMSFTESQETMDIIEPSVIASATPKNYTTEVVSTPKVSSSDVEIEQPRGNMEDVNSFTRRSPSSFSLPTPTIEIKALVLNTELTQPGFAASSTAIEDSRIPTQSEDISQYFQPASASQSEDISQYFQLASASQYFAENPVVEAGETESQYFREEPVPSTSKCAKSTLPELLPFVLPSHSTEPQDEVFESDDLELSNWDYNVECDVVTDELGQEWLKSVDSAHSCVYINLSSGEKRYGTINAIATKRTTAAETAQRNKNFRFNWLRKYFPEGAAAFWHPVHTSIGRLNKDGNIDIVGKTILGPTVRNCIMGNGEPTSSKWRLGFLEDTEQTNVHVSDYWERPVGLTEFPIPNLSAPELNIWTRRLNNAQSCVRFSKEDLCRTKVIAQCDNKFIVATIPMQSPSNEPNKLLVMFDQHAVHERIRLEKLIEDCYQVQQPNIKTKVLVTCNMHPPIQMTFSEAEVRILKSYYKNFEAIGVGIVPVNSTLVKVTSAPKTFVDKIASEPFNNRDSIMTNLLRSLIMEQARHIMDTNGCSLDLPNTIFNILCSQACRGAIKFGDPLELSTCQELISDLSKCKVPFQCAHGRPVLAPLMNLGPQSVDVGEGEPFSAFKQFNSSEADDDLKNWLACTDNSMSEYF